MPNIEIEETKYHNCPYCHRITPDYAICNCAKIYNKALEDFSKKMKEVNLTNSFVLYYGDEIDLEEFMNLASDEIKEELIK